MVQEKSQSFQIHSLLSLTNTEALQIVLMGFNEGFITKIMIDYILGHWLFLCPGGGGVSSPPPQKSGGGAESSNPLSPS